MALNEHQQIIESITRAKQTLIVFPNRASEDALGAAVALSLVFHKLAKTVDIASANYDLPEEFKFLPRIENVKKNIQDLRKFIISLNIEKTKVGDFSYEVRDKSLDIYVTPQGGFFNPEDVSSHASNFKYDLIITLATQELEALGQIYDEHSEFFFKIPVVNIDHSASNESFGHINLVDVTAASVSEVVFELLTAWERKFVDEDVATALLAGLTHKTQSFRAPNLGPRTLSVASQLVALGAEREKVIDNLYRTKTITTLKLWGRVLARLKYDRTAKILWSPIPKLDFEKSGAGENSLKGVVNELISTAEDIDIIALIYEKPNGNISALVQAFKGYINLKKMLTSFDPVGNNSLVSCQLKDANLNTAEDSIIAALQENKPTRPEQ
jgi:nanoRNase/pAp phosphatase (c-di-AMP/oligoRNAs hydrolase)